MQKLKGKSLWAIAIVICMLGPLSQPLINSDGQIKPTIPLTTPLSIIEEENLNLIDCEQKTDENELTQSSINVMEGSEGNENIEVIVATTDIGELGMFLEKNNYRKGKIGCENAVGMAFPILSVPDALIPKIEKLTHVVGVYRNQKPIVESFDDISPTTLSTGIGTTKPFGVGDYSGEDIKVAVVDTGVDFGHPQLSAKYSVAPDVNFNIIDEIVIEQSDGNVTNARLAHLNIIPSSYVIKRDSQVLTETTDYTLNLATGEITFTNVSILPAGTALYADYSCKSPYIGWPMAFDSASMKQYIDSTARPGGWYVNMSYNGTGPFEDVHIITVDGEKDFGEVEKIAEDYMKDESSVEIGSLPPDYNVDDLYVTRDLENLYLGFTTFTGIPTSKESEQMAHANISYGIYIDVDGPGSGGSYDPRGNYIDTNSSHANFVNAVSFSPSGNMLASASGGKQVGSVYYKDTSIKIWNPSTGLLLQTLTGHTADKAPKSLAWAPNGTMLASADSGNIYLWDITNGMQIGTPIDYSAQGHPIGYTDLFSAISINQNGSLIAIGGQGSITEGIGLYNLATKSYEKRLAVGGGINVHSVAFNPNGTLLAAALSNGTLQIFNIITGSSEFYNGHSESIFSVAWNSGGTQFATGSRDQTIRIWNLGSPSAIKTFNSNYTNSIVWSPDNSKIAVGTSFTTVDYNNVEIWDLATNSLLNHFTLSGKVTSVDWYNDLIVSGSEDATVRTWDVAGGAAGWGLERIFKGYLPDYAAYIDHTGVEWGLDGEGKVWEVNDTIGYWMLYKWDGAQSKWTQVFGVYNETVGLDTRIDAGARYLANNTLYKDGIYYEIPINNTITINGQSIKLTNVSGKLGYSGYLDYKKSGFLEIGINRTHLGNPQTMNFTLFTTNDTSKRGASHVQDIVQSDPNIEFTNPDFNRITTSLAAFKQYTPEKLYVQLSTANQSKSVPPKYYTGNHPDKNFITQLGSVGTLLVDYQDTGVYDRLYIDGNHDKIYSDDDPYIDKNTPARQFHYEQTVGGVVTHFNYSTGLLYFIADGRNAIPYSDVYAKRYGIKQFNFTNEYIPRKGELVCLMGEFNLNTEHGTKLASAITTRAENSTIISIGDVTEGNYFDSLYFAAEGYDGVLDTEDDAKIISIGVNYPNTDTGLDIYSKFTDWLSTIYTSGNLVCVAPVGDTGNAYGSVMSPATGSTVIGVGSATDYNIYLTEEKGGPNHHMGDVFLSSGRGPSVMGSPKPDVINFGVTNVSLPLIHPDGDKNYKIWNGTGAAAALTTGDLALIYEAYYKTTHTVENEVLAHAINNMTTVKLKYKPILSCTIKINGTTVQSTDYNINLTTGIAIFNYNITIGKWINATYTYNNDFPDVSTARSLLMSSADDTYNDVLTQGAGIVNIYNSIQMANGTKGLILTPSTWVPGNFEGTQYDSFVNLMYAGEVDEMQFTIENVGPGQMNAKIEDSYLKKIGEYTFSHTMSKEGDTTEQAEQIQVVINSTGIYKVIGSGVTSELQIIMPIDPILWHTSQLMKVNAVADWTLVYDDEYGDLLHDYRLDIFDWTDDKDIANAIVGTEDLNKMSSSFTGESSNTLETRIFDAARRTHDGIVVELKHISKPGESKQEIPWSLIISFYNRTDWQWLSVNSNDIIVNPLITEGFNATMNLPTDVTAGSYEGAIRITYDETSIVGETVTGNALTGTIALQLDHQDIIGNSLVVNKNSVLITTGYTLDAQSGTIIFSPPLASGDNITVSYTYSESSILLPVFVTVAASRSRCSFGGETVFNVTDEVLTNVDTYSVNNEWLFKVNKYRCNETIVVPQYSVNNEVLVNNLNRSVINETLFIATGEEGVNHMVWFDHTDTAHSTDGLEYAIVPGSVQIYNGTTLLVEDIDYIIPENGTITNGGGNVKFLQPLLTGHTFTASYSYYQCNVQYAILKQVIENNKTKESLISVFKKDGSPLGASEWDFGGDTITFTAAVPAGEIYTADYIYYEAIQYYTLKFDTGSNENTTDIQSTCVLYKNGVKMIIGGPSNLNYQFKIGGDHDGEIFFQVPLKDTDIVFADYYYYPLYQNWSLTHGDTFFESIVNNSFIIQNRNVPFNRNHYTIDCANGLIIFNQMPEPDDNLSISYRYYNTSLYHRSYMNINDPQYGFGYGILNHNNIIPGSCLVQKNANTLQENVDYNIDCAHGLINYTKPIAATDVVQVSYAYSDTTAHLFNSNGIFSVNDNRFYYILIQDQGLNQNLNGLVKMSVSAKWENKPSDIDIAIWGSAMRGPTIPGSENEKFPSSRFGAVIVEELTRSKNSDIFYTVTNESNELLVTTLKSGLNIIEINGQQLNGTTPFETITIEVGSIYLSQDTILVHTQNLSGKAPISVISTLDWFGSNVSALGPAVGKMYKNVEVFANDPAWGNYKTFQEQLATGQLKDEPLYTMAVDVKNAATFEVHIWGYSDCPDLDLGVFLDGKNGKPKDGITQTEEFVDYGADADADEQVLIVNPDDGTYLIRVYGFTVTTNPGHFDMKVSMIISGIEGYGLEGVGDDIEPAGGIFTLNETIPSYTIQNYNLTWNLPGNTLDDEYGGVVYIGPSNAPEILNVLAKIIIDRQPPVIKNATMPMKGQITGNERPTISAEIEDKIREEIDADSMKLFVDGIDVTSLSKTTVGHVADTGGSGYPQGIVTYIPTVPLSDGAHIVEVKASDWAGNEAVKVWSFTVDTKKPTLTIDSISKTHYTNQNAIQLTGSSEPDVSVSVIVGATPADVKRDTIGGFWSDIELEVGSNQVFITVTDNAGNEVRQILTVIRDTEAPTFEKLICQAGTLTNQQNTMLSGTMSEVGTLIINGDPTSLNSDGTFDKFVELNEGINAYGLQFTDLAGNNASRWFNITLDTQAPTIDIGAHESTVKERDLNITGITDAGATLKVNGKLVQVDASGNFNKLLQLSPGPNAIVIESKDAAGNVNQVYMTVAYDTAGTNAGAIGMMVVLLIIGLLIGLLFARFILWPPEAKPEAAEESKDGEAKPEEEEAAEPEKKTPAPETETEAEPEVPEKVEDVKAPEAPKAEPIPKEEGMPKELPTEDERIAKLTKAFKEGKISKELYEKNLAKFQQKK